MFCFRGVFVLTSQCFDGRKVGQCVVFTAEQLWKNTPLTHTFTATLKTLERRLQTQTQGQISPPASERISQHKYKHHLPCHASLPESLYPKVLKY